MSSKLTAAKAFCCFHAVDGDAAAGSKVVEESKGCDPCSSIKNPGIVYQFASSEGTIAPRLIASNAGDDTIKPKSNIACEGTIIACKDEAYGGEPAASLASPSSTPEVQEDLSELEGSFRKSSLATTAAQTKKLPILAAEIWSAIIKLAMTSDLHGTIMFDCGTGRAFKPNVAVQLLRVNHATYHEAITSLYSENIFFFDHFGSDLKVIDKSVGLSSCLLGDCPSAMKEPKLKTMVLHLGSENDMYMGSMATRTFQYALRALRYRIHVEELLLHILPYSFLSEERVKEFAADLSRIKVSHSLIITGAAAQYDYDDVYTIAVALGMDKKPVERYVRWDDRFLIEQGYSYHRFKAANSLDINCNKRRVIEGNAIARACSERTEAIAL